MSEEIELEPLEDKPVDLKEILNSMPEYIKPYLEASFGEFRPNMEKGSACFLCAVNSFRVISDGDTAGELDLNETKMAWVKRNFCAKCDATEPFIRVRVTEAVQFEGCKKAWKAGKLKQIPWQPPEAAMVYGSVHHFVDEYMQKFLAESSNRQMFYDLNQNYFSLYSVIKNMILKALAENKPLYKQYEQFKDEISTLIDVTANVYAFRLINDIKARGEYMKMLAQEVENRLVAPYIVDGIKMLITGKPDKLYKFGGGWFVEDDKTRALLKDDMSFDKYGIQLGGYKFLIEQMLGETVSPVGAIRFPRYFDFAPVVADSEQFLKELKGMAKVIKNGEEPKGCGQDWCIVCKPKKVEKNETIE